MSRLGKRILRDVSVLVVFCGVFFGAVMVIKYLQASPDAPDLTDFSDFRIRADTASVNKDFEVAVDNLQAMVTRDPFDGRARYLLAKTRYNMFRDLDDELKDAAESASTDVAATPEDVEQLQRRRDELLAVSIECFDNAISHARYYENSCYFLSILHTAQGNKDQAIEYLKVFVDAGRYHPRGLESTGDFDLLRDHPKFPGIVEVELKSRQEYFQSFPQPVSFFSVSPNQMDSDGTGEAKPTEHGSEKNVNVSDAVATTERKSIIEFDNWFSNNLVALRRQLINFIRVFFE